MSDDEILDIVTGPAWTIVVRAPVGCGKTHCAANAARRMGEQIQPGQEVLVLAHTNAAVHELRGRTKGCKRIRVMTLDSFAFELVQPFARPLGLMPPVLPGTPGSIPFARLAGKAVEILRRSVTVAQALAVHYPVILVDEHQDSRTDQHDLVMAIVAAGDVRLRVFGDAMQAIHSFDGSPLVDVVALAANADHELELSQPWRWRRNARLGEWLSRARSALASGSAVAPLPKGVSVRIRVIPGAKMAPPPNSNRLLPTIASVIRTTLTECGDDSVGVLTGTNAHAVAVKIHLQQRVRVYEGVDTSVSEAFVTNATEHAGRGDLLARDIVTVLGETCSGMDKQKRAQIESAVRRDGIVFGTKRILRRFLQSLQVVYQSPTLDTACAVLRDLADDLPDWLSVHSPQSLYELAQFVSIEEEAPLVTLARLTQTRRQSLRLPRHCVSTIHKAKGREFDHVILLHCASNQFPDTEYGRRLFYVALTRATKSLTLLVPEEGPTPLLTLGG